MANFDDLDTADTNGHAADTERLLPGDEHEAVAQTKQLTRRGAAKLAAVGLGALAVGSALPRQWFPPIVQVAFLPAHAMASHTMGDREGGSATLDPRKLPKVPVPTSSDGAPAGPTEVPPPPAGGPTPPPPPPANAPPTGGGTRGSRTQPRSATPPGAGGPSCNPLPTADSLLQPTNLVVTPTATSATITWDGQGEPSFLVEVYQSCECDGGYFSVRTVGSIANVSGLKPCTDYDVYVYPERCGVAGNSPAYTEMQTLMDPSAAPQLQVPDNHRFCDGFLVEWDYVQCALYYEVQISDDNGATWRSQTTGYYQSAVNVIALCPDTVHLVRVRAIGSGRGPAAFGAFSATTSVTTRGSEGDYCNGVPDNCPPNVSSNDNRTQ